MREDLGSASTRAQAARPGPSSFKQIDLDQQRLSEVIRRNEVLLIPPMGPDSDAMAACLRAIGVRAEVLPAADRETVRVGRRYTSGKECVPMCMSLGNVVQRLERDHSEDLFCVAMPRSHGPCRFGAYNLLFKVTLERLGWKDRVRMWSPEDTGYFDDAQIGWFLVAFIGFMAEDLLLEALHFVRPTEQTPGAATAIYHRRREELHQLLEQRAAGDLTTSQTLAALATGRLFGFRGWLRGTLQELTAVGRQRQMPSVLVVGEIYVRCVSFANDFVIQKLEQRGIRCRFAPFNEWLEYTSWLNLETGVQRGFSSQAQDRVQRLVQDTLYHDAAGIMGWPRRTTVKESVRAAADYLRWDLHGEAVLTIGGPVHEHRAGLIDGVVSVGPLECMPNKISEAQFFHAAEREGLLSLTLSLNGDPMDPEVLDNFAFEVHTRFRQRQEAGEITAAAPASEPIPPRVPRPISAGPIRTEIAPPAERPAPDREAYPEMPLQGRPAPSVRRRSGP